jgi:hypothetical protein
MVIGKEMGQLPVADRRQIVGAAITILSGEADTATSLKR